MIGKKDAIKGTLLVLAALLYGIIFSDFFV